MAWLGIRRLNNLGTGVPRVRTLDTCFGRWLDLPHYKLAWVNVEDQRLEPVMSRRDLGGNSEKPHNVAWEKEDMRGLAEIHTQCRSHLCARSDRIPNTHRHNLTTKSLAVIKAVVHLRSRLPGPVGISVLGLHTAASQHRSD